MTFSTVGPDCYADGSQVLDGEYYALVWQTASAGEVTFTLAGETTDAKKAVVLRALPRAKDGKCPLTTFAVDTSTLPKLSGTGTLRLYLLDTRIYNNGIAVIGGLGSVQASVPVTANCKVTTGSAKGKLAASAGFTVTEVPADVPSPRITGITVAGGTVTLMVEGTVNGVNYTADDPLSSTNAFKVTPVTGKTGKTVKFNIPQGATSSSFFRVKRNK